MPLVVPFYAKRVLNGTLKKNNLNNKNIQVLPVYVRVSSSTLSGKNRSCFKKHQKELLDTHGVRFFLFKSYFQHCFIFNTSNFDLFLFTFQVFWN